MYSRPASVGPRCRQSSRCLLLTTYYLVHTTNYGFTNYGSTHQVPSVPESPLALAHSPVRGRISPRSRGSSSAARRVYGSCGLTLPLPLPLPLTRYAREERRYKQENQDLTEEYAPSLL